MEHEITSSNLVYKSDEIRIYEDQLKSKEGKIEVLNRINLKGDAAIVVPLFQDGSLLMVENYRHGARTILLELPAGMRSTENEEPFETARRELLEETGYTCRTLEELNWYYTWPAKVSQKMYVFLAKGLERRSSHNLTDFENVKVRILSRQQVIHEIKHGKIKSPVTISALVNAYFSNSV
jgi:ADP-ribose pyrophosphatase